MIFQLIAYHLLKVCKKKYVIQLTYICVFLLQVETSEALTTNLSTEVPTQAPTTNLSTEIPTHESTKKQRKRKNSSSVNTSEQPTKKVSHLLKFARCNIHIPDDLLVFW